MKKILTIFLSLIVVLSGFSVANAENSLNQLVISDAEGYVGQTVTLTLSVSNPNDFNNFEAVLVYDETVLSFTGVTNEQSNILFDFSRKEDNFLNCCWSDDEDVEGGVIYTLTFKILDGAVAGTSYEVSFKASDEDDEVLADDYAHRKEYSQITGAITVKQPLVTESVTLDENVNYRVNFADDIDDTICQSSEVFVLGEKVDVNVKTDGTTRYIEFELPIKNINSQIKIVVYSADKSLTYQTFETTIAGYLTRIIAEYKDKASGQTLVKMAQATLKYGAAAQLYFGQDMDTLATEEEPTAKATVLAGLSEISTEAPTTPDYLEYRGQTLLLENEITLRNYFTVVSEGDLSGYTQKGEYYYTATKLAPTELEAAMSYCKAALNKSDCSANLEKLCCALYDYWKAALAY